MSETQTTTVPRINLMSARKPGVVLREEQARRIGIYGGVVLILLTVALAGVVGYRFYLAQSLAGVTQKISQQTQLITGLEATEQKYTLVANKAGLIASLIDGRIFPQDRIRGVVEILPEGVVLAGITRPLGEERLVVRLSGKDVFVFEKLVVALETLQKNGTYAKLFWESPRRDTAGVYSTEVELVTKIENVSGNTPTAPQTLEDDALVQ